MPGLFGSMLWEQRFNKVIESSRPSNCSSSLMCKFKMEILLVPVAKICLNCLKYI